MVGDVMSLRIHPSNTERPRRRVDRNHARRWDFRRERDRDAPRSRSDINQCGRSVTTGGECVIVDVRAREFDEEFRLGAGDEHVPVYGERSSEEPLFAEEVREWSSALSLRAERAEPRGARMVNGRLGMYDEPFAWTPEDEREEDLAVADVRAACVRDECGDGDHMLENPPERGGLCCSPNAIGELIQEMRSSAEDLCLCFRALFRDG